MEGESDERDAGGRGCPRWTCVWRSEYERYDGQQTTSEQLLPRNARNAESTDLRRQEVCADACAERVKQKNETMQTIQYKMEKTEIVNSSKNAKIIDKLKQG